MTWKYELQLDNGEIKIIELDQPINKLFEISDGLRRELELRKSK